MSPVQPCICAPSFLATIRLSSPVLLVVFVVSNHSPAENQPPASTSLTRTCDPDRD